LSNKIAAGEVIERPASVVKELVENALDAGSTRILLELENAGRSLIQISDNGLGMNRDDALLAIERYATSKISSDRDLFAIRSLGFRGEALPSIASVSKFTLESRDENSDVGVRIEVAGGKVTGVSDAGLPVGTQISVRQLFYNIPARRKFLKTPATEMGHVVDTLASIALAWPDTQFQLTHNGKPVKNWTAARNAPDRIADVVGREVREDLLPLSFSQNGISLEGWVSSGRTVRSTSRGIYLYVNQRFVRDSLIRHALMAGFSGRIVTGRFPVAVLFLTVPPDCVDVNVHPTKHAVRFTAPREIHHAIESAVSDTLQRLDRPARTWAPQSPAVSQTAAEPPTPYTPEPPPVPAPRPAPSTPSTTSTTPAPVSPAPTPAPPETPPAPAPPIAKTQQQPLFTEKAGFSDLKLIGQLHDTYIICESPVDGLILIDQHAAHERVLFEALKKKSDERPIPVQQLLIPETVDLSFSEARTLSTLLPELTAFGLEIEPFGGDTFAIKAAPAMLAGKPLGPLVLEIAEKATDTDLSPRMETPLDRIRWVMACHGAIRAGQRLSDTQIKELLRQMDACDNPATCPHGRPTWIKWRLPAIEKAFHRVV
jgi:DNA mismatch repair protein MutL